MERTQMRSVGIDIGTSTTQMAVSLLTVENTAGFFAVPRASIVGKEVVYRSPIYETPLLDETRIDGPAVGALVEETYRLAGLTPDQVQTGAVIITGETARKENAAAVLAQISGFAGDFVVSTAGPDLEALIAGQGSGAQRASEEAGAVVMNLDIGGGTTNVAVFDSGEPVAQGCFDIGGRQARFAPDGRLTALSAGAQRVAEAYGISLTVGECPPPEALTRLCDGMNELLEQACGLLPRTRLLDLVTTPGSTPFAPPGRRPVTHLCFSGGVADCMDHLPAERFAFGDLGMLLAQAIRRGRLLRAFRIVHAQETIRATVIGAGSHTTSISGSTIDAAAQLLPLKNLPVLKLTELEEARVTAGDSDLLRNKARWFLQQNDVNRLALGMAGPPDPSYEQLQTLAEAVAAGLNDALPAEAPVVVVLRQDVAKALGLLLRPLLSARAVLCIDGVRTGLGGFLDLGRPVLDGMAVPVVVKTLIFGE